MEIKKKPATFVKSFDMLLKNLVKEENASCFCQQY